MGSIKPENQVDNQDIDEFNRKIEAAEARLDGLHSLATAQDPHLLDSIEEISTLLEELHISQEELRNTNDELQNTQNSLISERERYQDLFHFAPDGYLETDECGKILEANQAVARMLNVSPSFLYGKILPSFTVIEDRQEFREKLYILTSKDTESAKSLPEEWEFRLQPRDQDPIYAALTVALYEPFGRRQEEKTLVRWMVRDITEWKQAQIQLQESNEELEARVAERTSQLSRANAKLRKAARELELRNRELDDFAVVASHDLKEPLRKIRAFGERLAVEYRPILGVEGLLYLDRMVRASQRMDTMIESLLEYARITSREMPFQRTDLNKIARDVAADLEESIHQTHGRVEIGNLPTIEANQVQMRQLLQNLISNGLKFHRPEVPPLIKVTGELVDDKNQKREDAEEILPQPYAEIRVEDNGIGFEENAAARAFQPFQRLVGRGEFEGTGMGLAICKRIVERHGGTIGAESRLREGTKFIIRLPVRQSSELGKNDPGKLA